jgi:hypothetical protein
MKKQQVFTYTKMNQDISKSKFSNEIYYEGRNIRIIANEAFGSITNEKGNDLVLTVPEIEGNPTLKTHLDDVIYPIENLRIMGTTVINKDLYLLVKGDADIFAIYKIDEDYNISLIFFDILPTGDKKFDVVGFYENDNNIKLYWADGVHELRYANVAENIINLERNFLSTVPSINLTEPKVMGFSETGSAHTAGSIQYAYNLYRTNGAQTRISPLSRIEFLNNGDSGDQTNTPVNKAPIVRIDGLDTNFDRIKIYSIKYSVLNSTPLISLIYEDSVSEEVQIVDDNNGVIQEITFQEFIFLGGDIYIPQHLITKDNHLFMANYKTEQYDIDFDARAYRYDVNGIAQIRSKSGIQIEFADTEIPEIPEEFDAINPTNKAQYASPSAAMRERYVYSSETFVGFGGFILRKMGGTGPNVSYTIEYDSVPSNFGEPTMQSSPSSAIGSINRLTGRKSLKSGEVYRLGIEFLLNNGKYSFTKWVGDVYIPEVGTLLSQAPVDSDGNINYAYIKTTLLNPPTDPRVVGWRTVIVERRDTDKSVVSQGIYDPVIEDNFNPGIDVFPSYFQRVVKKDAVNRTFNVGDFRHVGRYNTSDDDELNLSGNLDSATAFRRSTEITSDDFNYKISKSHGMFYSPEVTFNKSNLGVNSINIRKVGLVQNTHSYSSRELYDVNGTLITEQNLHPDDSTQNTSKDMLITNARLLTSLIPIRAADNAVTTAKFISSIKEANGDEYHSKRLFSFVRYFSGYKYLRENLNLINTSNIDANAVQYIAPIQNIYAVKNNFTNETIIVAPNSSPVVRPDNDTTNPTTFKHFTGSGLFLANVGNGMRDMTGMQPFVSDDAGDYGQIIELYRILENQYGGDTYTARQGNRYIPYSSVQPISENVTTEHIGDTFIQKFNFLKAFRVENTDIQMVEIVSIPVETSINLDLRYDLLKNRPDNKEADENTSYGWNTVYNQTNNTIRSVPRPFNFTEINNFPVNIIPSRIKIPGELVDSFTDFLINDAKSLDGKYGEITGLGEHQDQVYSFQRNAVAAISINPRVQIQASDGIPIELGTGRLIERYQYLTTNSGTVSKWSIVKTKNGLMYVDLFNRSINFLADQELSTVSGLYNKVKDFCRTEQKNIEADDVLNKMGVLAHYDNNREDIYFTFLSPTDTGFTVAFNGLSQGFTSYYDFVPTSYIQLNGEMLTTNDNTRLWEHGKGDYQTFYGQYYPLSLTLLANPEPYRNKTFDNMMIHTEVSLDGQDQPFTTFNTVRVWNDYQDSGVQPLDINERLSRRFRNWFFNLPRQENSRDRINNQWAFIKLEFNHEENYKLVLHDSVLSYL